MTINYAGTNPGSFPTNIPAPEDDEDVDGASVQQVAQAAANRDKVLFDRLAGALEVGVIAGNHQIDTKVGIVYTRMAAGNNTDYNLAMPAPSGSNPFLMFKFSGGGTGTSRRVWITNTANLAVSAPTDYYAYWVANTDAQAGCIFWYDGTLWRIVSHYGMSGTTGGGALADV